MLDDKLIICHARANETNLLNPDNKYHLVNALKFAIENNATHYEVTSNEYGIKGIDFYRYMTQNEWIEKEIEKLKQQLK